MEKEKISQEVKEKITGLLHLARKAGKVVFGYDACQRSCLKEKAKLILVARDLSKRQKANLEVAVKVNKIDLIEFGSKQYLGEVFKLRDVGIICIEDRNFASGIVKKLRQR